MKKIENQYLKIEQEENGYIHINHKNGGVIVLALTQDDKFAMIKIRRPKVVGQARHFEFPRGFKETGESSLISAARELREETGIDETYDWQEIGFFYPDNGIMDNKVWVMTCRCRIEDEELLPQKEEGIQEIVFYSEKDIMEKIADKEITDGISLAAFLIYLSKNKY